MASPRTSAEPQRSEIREPREGLSVQTLIIAAISSGIAAIVVSHVWERGTILASAMTPVIVALVSEALKKPVQSERLRSGVRSVSSRPRSGRTPTVLAPPAPGIDEGLRQRDEGREAGPVRVYSSGSNRRGGGPRRRLHPRVAVATGLIAFLIAAAALTLPELLFGGSVGGGDRSTTYFGGGEKASERGEAQDGEPRDGQPDDPTQQDPAAQPDPEAPVVPGEDGSDDAGGEEPPAPQPTPPTPTTPPEAPTQPPRESESQGQTP